MAGFFGLFRSKTKYVDEPDNKSSSPSEESEAFFLSGDEAKTLGNLDFMRKPTTIRRTFPKTKSNQNTELIKQVSSFDKVIISGGNQSSTSPPIPTSKTAPEQPNQTDLPTVERRRADSTMDRFRNMAREINK